VSGGWKEKRTKEETMMICKDHVVRVTSFLEALLGFKENQMRYNEDMITGVARQIG
jgi:hypothetical protein